MAAEPRSRNVNLAWSAERGSKRPEATSFDGDGLRVSPLFGRPVTAPCEQNPLPRRPPSSRNPRRSPSFAFALYAGFSLSFATRLALGGGSLEALPASILSGILPACPYLRPHTHDKRTQTTTLRPPPHPLEHPSFYGLTALSWNCCNLLTQARSRARPGDCTPRRVGK